MTFKKGGGRESGDGGATAKATEPGQGSTPTSPNIAAAQPGAVERPPNPAACDCRHGHDLHNFIFDLRQSIRALEAELAETKASARVSNHMAETLLERKRSASRRYDLMRDRAEKAETRVLELVKEFAKEREDLLRQAAHHACNHGDCRDEEYGFFEWQLGGGCESEYYCSNCGEPKVSNEPSCGPPAAANPAALDQLLVASCCPHGHGHSASLCGACGQDGCASEARAESLETEKDLCHTRELTFKARAEVAEKDIKDLKSRAEPLFHELREMKFAKKAAEAKLAEAEKKLEIAYKDALNAHIQQHFNEARHAQEVSR